MRVYDESTDEMHSVTADTAEDAAQEVHSIDDGADLDGCEGFYRVEEKPGEWVRVRVVTRVEVTFDAETEGDCDAPEAGDA